MGFSGDSASEESPAAQEMQLYTLSYKDAWRREQLLTAVFRSGESPMHRGACRARIHGVTEGWTWLSNTHTHTDTHIDIKL